MASLNDIVAFADEFLQIDQFKDYCPNGLQVEGKAEVQKILCGVTASEALLDGAISKNADMVLVHHGYFWRGESYAIVGLKYKKIKKLIENGISLVGYHLPLDAHATCGNNATLAKRLGVTLDSSFGDGAIPLGVAGVLSEEVSASVFNARIESVLGRTPLHIGADENKVIRKVGLCTGGAQNYFEAAIAHGVDIYITGEVSEKNYHVALESGVDFIAAGHHATERYGVQALAEIISKKFDVETEYFELANPV